MTGDLVPVRVLTVQAIPNVSPELAAALGLRADQRSVGLLSADCDDAAYIALDEATKAAQVEVVYAKSLYAGAPNATTALAGEVVGILAGPDPAAVTAGLRAAVGLLSGGVGFRTANDEGSVVYLAHCVSRAGTYLSRLAKVRTGEAVAYLIAPPVEALLGLDVALKAAAVELTAFYPPPSETNFAGGLLTGAQDACRAACDAFAAAVRGVAAQPNQLGG
ncbi:MAG: ethanolamine utilization microcompartment protein EutL [Oscillospiraceae bacterium]|nr:ethanolamine utilization microcompartment protein EutL [Oscillospiraceae bacterium]